MNRSIKLPYNFIWSTTHPHIAWADIYANGVLVEIAVVALDENNGDLYFIPIASLDHIDKERLLKIITKRDSEKYPLWDIMSSSTLKNGINALEYFNQIVKVRSVSGQIFTPGAGKVGAGVGPLTARPQTLIPPNVNAQPAQAAQPAPQQYVEVPVSQPARRGPGRPPAPKR